MPKNSVAVRLGTEGKQQVKNDFAEVGTAGDAAAKRLGDAFERESQRADRARQKMAANAAKIAAIVPQTGIQMRINDAVGTGFAQFEGSARRSAQAFLEAERAEAQLEARTRALMAAIDPAWAAQERFNDEIREAKTLLDAGRISTTQYAAAEMRAKQALDATTASVQRNVGVSGAMRAGGQQLAFQLGDMATMWSLNAKGSTIFATQSGQVIQAISMMSGGAGMFATFMAGPWGIAMTGALLVLGPLVSKLWEGEDAMKAVELASDSMRQAQSTLGEMFDLTTGKIKNQNDMLLLNAQIMAINLRADAAMKEASSRGIMASAGSGKKSMLDDIIATVTFRSSKVGSERVAMARQMQGWVQQYRAGSLSPADFAKLAETIPFDGLGYSREELLQALSDNATAKRNREVADMIERSVSSGSLDSRLRRSGTTSSSARTSPGSGARGTDPAREAERLAQEQARIVAGFENRFDPYAALARKTANDMAELEKIKGIISPDQFATFAKGIDDERMKALFDLQFPDEKKRQEQVERYRTSQASALALAEKEVTLIGRSRSERDRELSLLELKQRLLEQGIDLTSVEGQEILANHAKLQMVNESTRAANDNWSEAARIGENFIDTVLDPSNWDDWGALGKRVINDLISDLIRLAAINPLKNALFGSELPVLGGVLGAFKAGVGKSDAGGAISTIFGKGGLGFAAGTEYFSGGMATVGEFGPENVFLPRGSRIMTAPETRRMKGAGALNLVVNNTISADGADAAALARVEAKLEQMNSGMQSRIVSTVNDARQRGYLAA